MIWRSEDFFCHGCIRAASPRLDNQTESGNGKNEGHEHSDKEIMRL